MIEINGLHNSAICYTKELENYASEQIRTVCDRVEFADSKIRIMPDVHAGKGCTIGTTMTIKDKIVPAMVGVDIGCGMETVKISDKAIDFEKLDKLIRKEIPCGREIRNDPHQYASQINLADLKSNDQVNIERAYNSIGTLGGGNHFIELDKDENGDIYLVVHSGSRHIGNEVAKYYQDEGYNALCGNAKHQMIETLIKLKNEGRHTEIQSTIQEMRKNKLPSIDIPKELSYVEGSLFKNYIYDMNIIQRFADLNRKAITQVIIESMGFSEVERFTTVHNYIDTEAMILRKGAVAAYSGQKILIPINMRDGSLICIGKGNEDWNCSAPHGAGRLMSRKVAVNELSFDEYKKEMQGVYSTCITPETIDESPMAYKSMDEIISQITPTAEIINRIKPVYNFKATE